MVFKANISMNRALYSWLQEIGVRMGARSVPGVARAILQAVMHASESDDAAKGMISMIKTLTEEKDAPEDSDFIRSLMDELSDASRMDQRQSTNINRRT